MDYVIFIYLMFDTVKNLFFYIGIYTSINNFFTVTFHLMKNKMKSQTFLEMFYDNVNDFFIVMHLLIHSQANCRFELM